MVSKKPKIETCKQVLGSRDRRPQSWEACVPPTQVSPHPHPFQPQHASVRTPCNVPVYYLEYKTNHYCSASEFRHPSEVRHLHFVTILKSFTVQLRQKCIPCR